MANLQIKRITIEKGALAILSAFGDYIRVLESDGIIEIRTTDSNVFLENGDSVRVEEFSSVEIINKHNDVNAITVAVGTGELKSDRLIGSITTKEERGNGQLYATINIDGETQVLGDDPERLSFRITNKTGSILRLGGVDVSQTWIEIEAGETYSDHHAPKSAIFVIGSGKVCIDSKYKKKQFIITPSNLIANGNGLMDGGQQIAGY